MKILKLKSIFFSLMAIAMVTVFLTSCEKEIIIEEDIDGVKQIINEDDLDGLLSKYPKEITIDNWEEFVYAPKEVIDFFQKKELNAMLTKGESESNDTDYFKGPINGYVKAFRSNAWRGISGVRMVDLCGNAITNGSGYYSIADNCDYFCASSTRPYNTAINGVSTLDLVYVQKHILGILPFTDTRQLIAADVNRDGKISTADILTIRKLALGILDSWPNSENLIFLPLQEYHDAEARKPFSNTDILQILDIYGSYPSCSFVTTDPDRRVIKTGDVNGTFSF